MTGIGEESAPTRKTIRILLVVGIQIFVVSCVIISIPLVLTLNALLQCNGLSSAMSTSMVEDLAFRSQINQVSTVSILIKKITSSAESIIRATDLALENYVNSSNPEAVFEALGRIKYSHQYPNSVFYGSVSENEFIVLTSDEQVYIQIPVASPDSSCHICQYAANYTQAEKDMATNHGSLAKVDLVSLKLGPFAPSSSGQISLQTRPWYKECQAIISDDQTIYWTEPYRFSDGSLGMTAARPLFDQNLNFVGAYGADVCFDDFQPLIQLNQTINTFTYIMTRDGRILAMSGNESTLTKPGGFKSWMDVQTPRIYQSAQYLHNQLGKGQDFYSLPPLMSYRLGDMYFHMATMTVSPYLIVISGSPISDYMVQIDAVDTVLSNNFYTGRTNVIAIAIALLIMMVALAVALSYYAITRPLASICKIIREGMGFDFRAFKDIDQYKGNYVTELAFMEETFYGMIEKFAEAIKNNKDKKPTSATMNPCTGAPSIGGASFATSQTPRLHDSEMKLSNMASDLATEDESGPISLAPGIP
ncbi:hypothetical protein BC830DRAFT_1154600 [Chytriomyces sp. MP71]|nr:hypothetical protein BC830DRAFT_1156384 [Chytriomyces sp. MP71]KAI8608613.1 hypothetical protein BC830DRAFT_1154600 [Chytriomyces sp. MP71]